jgi:glyoxylase-like metal-dependent hydrolase (beta-lactamase superfamily II)
MKRILFLGMLLAIAAAAAAAEPNDPIKQVVLSDRLLILEHGPWLETMTVLDAGPSLVVVDTWSSPVAAARAKALIDQRFHKPVSHVINTHYHWDHTFGNQVFAGAMIVGHVSCVAAMNAEYATPELRGKALDQALQGASEPLAQFIKAVRAEVREGFRLTVPNHLVTDRETLDVGDPFICLYHVPGLHTTTNLILYVRELGLVFTRREFIKGALPVLESGLDMAKLLSSLEEIQTASGPLQYVPRDSERVTLRDPNGGPDKVRSTQSEHLAEMPAVPIRYLICGHGDPVENPDLASPLAYLRLLDKTVKAAKERRGTLDQVKADAGLNAIPEVAKYPKVHQANLELVWRG